MSSPIATRIPVLLSTTGAAATHHRNVMAFGKRNAVSEHLSTSSQNVTVQFVQQTDPLEQVISEIAAVLSLCGIERPLHETIIHEMLTGEHDQPAFEAAAEDPILARYGHIMLPMVHAGVDYTTAARVTDLLLDLPTGHLLQNVRNHHYEAEMTSAVAA